MKNLYTFLVAVLLTATTFAQTPEKMSYQAVVRDSGDALVTSQAVGMQISILQTTATGTAVYVETQTPTTNVNGLLTLEIGTGAVVSGDFTTIDWSADSYFIKTETDPTGGASYTITGTSQLLSVPYALHAKTAESVTETQTLEDVATLGNLANTQLKNVTDPTDAQDATTKAYVDNLIATLEARITTLETQPATVGDFRDGGVVFWVDPTDNRHGLVCAIQDQGGGIKWYNEAYIATGATGTAIGTGTTNTATIISAQGAVETNYAAGLAKAYTGGGFNDWFLPSKDELNEMYLNNAAVNATATANAGAIFYGYYWSSTEGDSNSAWEQNFGSGNQGTNNKGFATSVRAVRAF
ncbi:MULTISPECIES: Lcl C-terminal domain-containing protein [Bizionia]|uniref:DUF1566 domain-containing protein n=1 Tax=Bizionia algoritergicola TaxID=291187 RepID=A0A5D0QX04_9FLAO|nr:MULTISPECIES: DUF1566 domain-containing protein [Bizionia]OBX22181.1 hypothetical protein BAA08_09565 [Bizionia sp. APA-3]TYB73246.1 DUF1566 domain-containing protein [Bizionia algoritergicola]